MSGRGPTQHGDDRASAHERRTDADVAPEEIVARLRLEARVRLLSGRGRWHLEPVPGAGLAGVLVADGPHGLRTQVDPEGRGAGNTVPATCFPTASGLGATWDEDLLREIGRALGRECRAKGVSVLLGPGLNLKRHPAGGRNFEYLSEDPLLSGRLAAALVDGVQSEGVGACPKHFVANNQERFRMTVEALVDERTLRELYLAGFEHVVEACRPWTVMCAYNRVNGEFCSDSHRLLTAVLRDEWGFDGLVMSDWGAVNDRVAGVRAGLDLEMPGSGGAHDAAVIDAVRSGTLPEPSVDRAAARVVALAQRATRTGAASGGGDADLDAHHALARRAAAAATVLLTNDGTLPLDAPGRVALVGAFAEQPRYQGAGSSQVTPTRLDTVLDTMRERLGDDAHLDYVAGYDPRTGATTDARVARAVAAAEHADVAVVLVGLPGSYESEGFDRSHLRLPGDHTRLVEAVTEAATTVVALCNGAPVELPWADRPAALVEAYLGGQGGGSGLVDVLFGDAEPGGRLAESFPVRAADLPADRNFPGDGRQVQYREGPFVGYRFHDTAGVPARFAFGHGLTYTSFAYDDLDIRHQDHGVDIRVTITNTGDRSGSEVVQCYVRPLSPAVRRAEKELRGFAKVRLDPGGSTTVALTLGDRAFSVYDTARGSWQVVGGDYEVLVGASSVDLRQRATVTVDGVTDLGGPVDLPAGFVATDEEFAAMLGHPIPPRPPTLPFHRNSTVTDLDTTWLGRRAHRLLTRAATAEVDAMLDQDDDATRRMMASVIAEAPLRAMVSLSGGRLSLRRLDVLIDLLNGRWGRALGRLVARPGRGRSRPRRAR